MKLSVVIPARNEEACIGPTVRELEKVLTAEAIDHEILVVDDNSSDGTEAVVRALSAELPAVRGLRNGPPSGFGLAVRKGLESVSGDAVAIYMADASDRPADVVRFFRTMVDRGVDCVFGSRFSKGGRVVNYPWPKLVLNRCGNRLIQVLFGIRYNDVTNAFKMYRREVIDGLRPFLSPHYNLTVELPLKSIVRGYSYAVVPNEWINRTTGSSKLRIKEMGSRYLFIVLYCLIEKWLSRGDYRPAKTEDGRR